MKILIADFAIAKYGGIIDHIISKVRALREMGHEVDIVQISPNSITEKRYKNKIKKFENKTYLNKLTNNSEHCGYEFDPYTGYWNNPYNGFFLPPSNRINIFDENCLDIWHNMIKDVDIIMWNFMPTRSHAWDGGNINFWWKFFDLPTNEIKQMFIVHDAYFDVRACHVTALKEKIAFLECAHIAAYRCCEHINIPRVLLLNPRYFEKGQKMPDISFEDRKIDFFAAHIFKCMKRMEDLLRSIPHLKKNYDIRIAGAGIEQSYMISEKKCKEIYKINKKNDPDIDHIMYGKKIWDVAMDYGVEYLGQICIDEVHQYLSYSKFAIDPSWAQHYAHYCRTHINGFIIEAILYGCYPIIRDYSGLVKGKENIIDPLFTNLRAIIIPYDATPKQFANELEKASKMTEKKYLEDTQYNYQLIYELFNAKKNMKEVLDIIKNGTQDLECGTDSKNVIETTKRVMEENFSIKLPIKWTT